MINAFFFTSKFNGQIEKKFKLRRRNGIPIQLETEREKNHHKQKKTSSSVTYILCEIHAHFDWLKNNNSFVLQMVDCMTFLDIIMKYAILMTTRNQRFSLKYYYATDSIKLRFYGVLNLLL